MCCIEVFSIFKKRSYNVDAMGRVNRNGYSFQQMFLLLAKRINFILLYTDLLFLTTKLSKMRLGVFVGDSYNYDLLTVL